jgi:coenzyme F420-0:L-glutamate ligase/coenzyme F420-1:gamma-L-glutamate ligase
MNILPVRTPILQRGDDVASVLIAHADLHDGDILVISSKAIATVEGSHIDLSSMDPTEEAITWSQKTKRDPRFMQAVINETERLNGTIIGHAPQTLLTEVRPNGLMHGTILSANAGLDESNVEEGYAIGWPLDPLKSVIQIHRALEAENKKLGIIISDSCCVPRRSGVSAFALVACGIDPLKSEIGHRDLFNHQMRVTVEATADQLCTAANTVMGNVAQSIPAAIIRDHSFPMTDFCGWVDGIEPKEDLFQSMFTIN